LVVEELTKVWHSSVEVSVDEFFDVGACTGEDIDDDIFFIDWVGTDSVNGFFSIKNCSSVKDSDWCFLGEDQVFNLGEFFKFGVIKGLFEGYKTGVGLDFILLILLDFLIE
jgi:hypothetical protein